MDEVARRIALARKAHATLASVLEEPASAVVRDAAIQRFEYTFEATWKAAQRLLREREGLEVQSPATAIRQSHAIGLLAESDARAGLEMVGDRNLTVHTYNESLAVRIFGALAGHAALLDRWISALERR